MIKKVHNKDIDRQSWDQFIAQSPQGNLYAQSWYLDIVSPDWQAYMVYEADQLAAVLPVYEGRKILFPFIVQPIFCQQLGLYTKPNLENAPQNFDKIIQDWQQKYWLISYSFNILNSSKMSGLHNEFSICLTHHLDLSGDYQSLFKNYSNNHKRNLKKAYKSGLTVTKSADIDSLILLFKQNKGLELKEETEKHYQVLKRIHSAANHNRNSIILFAKNQEGDVLAGGLFLLYNKSIVYLFGSSTEEGKKHGAMVLVQDTLIQTYAGSDHILDFEGSNIPSLARFYKGFGATEKKFYKLSYHKSALIKALKKIYKYVRFR